LGRAAGLGTAVGKTSFGVSIVPLKRKFGDEAEAEAVVAWKIKGCTRTFNA